MDARAFAMFIGLLGTQRNRQMSMVVVGRFCLGFLLFIGACSAPVDAQSDGATFVSQLVPREMEAGKTYQVSVTFRNTGRTNWTHGEGIRLGFQGPADNWTWLSGGRVDLQAGETIFPNGTKTFSFTITAPRLNTTDLKRFDLNFQWQMLREGANWFGNTSTATVVEVYPHLAISPSVPPSVAPAPVSPSLFDFHSFRGANVLESSVYDTTRNVVGWFPTQAQMEIIANQAVNMKLNYIRFAVPIPATNSGDALQRVIDATGVVVDTAYAYGLKTILVLSGYYGKTLPCNWQRSFDDIAGNAATVVSAFSHRAGVFAWDLANEPLWFGYYETYGGSAARDCLSTAAHYQNVVDGVHAMYELVRANDPTNKPTTVGEGKLPWLKFWNDVSSFASPHFYMPNTNGDFSFYHSMAGATIAQAKLEVGHLPLIVGEYGFIIGSQVADEAQRASAYAWHLNAMNAQGQNVGNMFWSLSVDTDTSSQGQQIGSLIDSNGNWKGPTTIGSAAYVVATQISQTNNASFVSQSVPAVMNRGQTYSASITMSNNGDTTWFQRQYKLGPINPENNTSWGMQRVWLNANPIEAIFPGQSKTFTFPVVAPGTPGVYNFQWQMLREDVERFGATTPNVAITVQ